MKVSIITVCYNSERTIKDTIDSVLSQTYQDIEYIIIDGLSTDNTLKIINGYHLKKIKVISEKDFGIYHAMNKGISLATGNIVAILNSDDVYCDPLVIDKVVRKFKRDDVGCVFGDLVYVDKDDLSKIVRVWKCSKFSPHAFQKGWHPAHPSFFVRRELYEKYGSFDLTIKISADFEIMLRLLEKYRVKSVYLRKVLVKMRVGGESGKNLKNIVLGNLNILNSFKKNDLKVNRLVYPFRRLLPKLTDLIYRKIF